jgi:acetylornithine deacetylase/succinyl-diaminopimelate desuccinylase-like protein
LHGGAAPNAAQAAASICASLYDTEGRITVDGFYEGIQTPTEQERKLAALDNTTPEEYRNQTGALPEGGIRALPLFERVGFLPTLEINGIHSGYAGPGNKTIIPAKAWVTMTSRIVPGQDPAKLVEAVKKHIQKQTPAGIQLNILQAEIGGAGLRFDLQSPLLPPAQKALQAVIPDKEVMYRWEGASIPIVARLAEVSGATPLLTGFGHEDDRIHAPNESFSLNQFRNGFLYTCLLLSQL